MSDHSGENSVALASEEQGQVTQLIHASAAGDEAAKQQLMEAVYSDLRKLAANLMRSERSNHTLQPTALVNEWMIKVLGEKTIDADNKQHLMATAARAMRHFLVDHARSKRAEKRGGGIEDASLQPEIDGAAVSDGKLLLIHDAIDRLEAVSERQAKVAELRLFGGFSIGEIAEALSITTRTVDRDWLMAKAWLKIQLK